MSDAAVVPLEVLIQIRDELAGLNRARAGIQGAKKDADSLGDALRQGLGIGGGMQLVTSGIAMLKQTLSATVGDAFRLATEVKNSAGAVGMATESYQVMKDLVEDTGGEMSAMAMAAKEMTEQIVKAGRGGSESLNALHLSAGELAKLPIEGKFEAVARAIFNADNKQATLAAGSEILGSRNLPKLTNALRILATDGYAKVAKEAKEAGQVMSPEAVERLAKARLEIANLKDEVTVGVGESLAMVPKLVESARKDFFSTARDFILAGLNPAYVGDLATTITKNVPTPAPKPPPAPLPPALATQEALLGARLDAAQWKAGQFQGNPLLSETQQRQAIVAVMREQEDVLNKLIQLKYSDVDIKMPEKGATEEELQRWRERVALEQKLSEVRQQRMQAVDTPMAALWREMEDTTSLINTTLATSVRSGVSQLGADVWNALKGTQAWGQAWSNMKNLAGQALTQIITQMLVVKGINMALGIFGYAISGVGPSVGKVGASTAVKAAGGGSFVTSGPTHFTVGDNPGGRELVSVIPISGIGQTTVNGSNVAMAGGGQALVAGAGAGSGDIFNFSYSFNGGVTREEVLGLIPRIVDASKSAVLDAQKRRRDGFRS